MVKFEENKMREHFLQRIQDVKMIPFTSSSSGTRCRKPLARTNTIHVYSLADCQTMGEKRSAVTSLLNGFIFVVWDCKILIQ